MNNEQEIQELIDRYLRDELSTTERAQFEQRIASDEALRRDVELTRHILQGFEHNGEPRIVAALAQMDEDALRRIIGAKRPARPKLRLAVASLAGIAATVALIIFGLQPRYTSAELFDSCYITPTYQPAPPSRGGEAHGEAYQRAVEAYVRGEFAVAAELFGEQSDEEQFYRAVSLFQIGQTDRAIALFTHLMSLDDSEYQSEARWMLALAYLESNCRAEARQVLTQIIETQDEYAGQARELILKIDAKKWF